MEEQGDEKFQSPMSTRYLKRKKKKEMERKRRRVAMNTGAFVPLIENG